MNWNERHIATLKKFYPKGTRVKCNYMADMYGVPSGTLGTVQFVDDAGTIHVAWDNGSSLGLIEDEDSFEVISG